MSRLSADKGVGLQSRVAGDALDVATLAALAPGSTKKGKLALAFAAVLGVTYLDVLGAAWVKGSESRDDGARRRDYRDRSGFPQGLAHARAAAQQGLKTAPENIKTSEIGLKT
jgi:hypothetical protein